MDRYSRRQLLSAGIGAAASAPCLARAATPFSLLQPTPSLHAPSAPDPTPIQGTSDFTDRLLLETYIGGKGPYHFIVDTGADRSVVAADVAASLGLLDDQAVIVQDIARAQPAQTVQLNNVTFGYQSIDTLAVPVLDRRWLGADGYLGLDAIADRRVTFDFLHKRLSITQSHNAPDWAGSADVVVRVSGANGRLKALNCAVDGVHAVAFVDSGSQVSIGNTSLFKQLQLRGKEYLGGVTPVYGVTGGEIIGSSVAVTSIRMGDVKFNRSKLIISDMNVFNIWGLADQPALFIGMNFLQQMNAFTVDYGQKEFRFKLAANVLIASNA